MLASYSDDFDDDACIEGRLGSAAITIDRREKREGLWRKRKKTNSQSRVVSMQVLHDVNDRTSQTPTNSSSRQRRRVDSDIDSNQNEEADTRQSRPLAALALS